jgi:hypothetical protein
MKGELAGHLFLAMGYAIFFIWLAIWAGPEESHVGRHVVGHHKGWEAGSLAFGLVWESGIGHLWEENDAFNLYSL